MSHPTEELTALADGALPPERAGEVRRHLEGCEACRAEASRLARAVAALRRLPAPPEPSPFFGTRLAARLEEERRRPRGLLARLAPFRRQVAVAALLLAAAAAVLVFRAERAERADEAALAQHLELLADYETVASLGDVETAEDVAVVAALGEEGAP